jgi:hypothetical protein
VLGFVIALDWRQRDTEEQTRASGRHGNVPTSWDGGSWIIGAFLSDENHGTGRLEPRVRPVNRIFSVAGTVPTMRTVWFSSRRDDDDAGPSECIRQGQVNRRVA